MTELKYLPNDPRQAVEAMLKLTEDLVARIEIESNSLAVNDGTTFTMNESSKEAAIDVYQQASNEFHMRVNEFMGLDKSLIEKLDSAQESLKQSTKNNLKILAKLQPKDAE